MGYLEEFGFKIYKLRDAKVENEYLLFDIHKSSYCCYSEKRLLKNLILEFREKDINIIQFAVEELNMDAREIKILKLLVFWIDDEIKLIDGVGFKPTLDKIFIKNNKTYFNSFKVLETFKRENYILDSPLTYEEFKLLAPHHHDLLYNLHNGDELAIKDTLLKLADKLKYPHEKAQDCIIFYPGEGSGKGIFYKYILVPIFGEYTKKVLMKKLNNDFNGFIREPLILVLEEGKRDLELVETLKEVITEGSVLINEKGKPQTEEDIYFLTFVFSNNMNPIDLGKRRGSYHLTHSLGKTVDDSQTKGAKLCLELPKETNFLLQYLHNLKFSHQDAMRPFNTKAKEQVNDLNKTPIELYYDFLLSYKTLETALIDLHERRYGAGSFYLNLEKLKIKDEDIYYISKDIFKDSYNNFCHIEGLKSNIIRHNKDIVQLWALFKIPEDSYKRVIVREGKNTGRRIDHLRVRDIMNHINEVKENE